MKRLLGVACLFLMCFTTTAVFAAKDDPGFFGGGRMTNCKKNSKPVFRRHVVQLKHIEYIDQWGTVTNTLNGLRGHTYLHIKHKAGPRIPGNVRTIPVYAPIDSYIIAYSHKRMAGDATSDWGFRIQVSCEVVYRLGHISKLRGKVKLRLRGIPPKFNDSRTTKLYPPLKLKAGQMIGTTSGTSGGASWDFGVYNTKNSNTLRGILKRFKGTAEGETYGYADCPYDYYRKNIRKLYYAKFKHKTCGPAN